VTEADNLEAKLSELFKSYVLPEGGAPRRVDTRMRIKRHLAEALERQRVIHDKAFEENVPAARWTDTSDTFTFDFGYAPAHPAPELWLIHALSLLRDDGLAETLRSKFDAILGRRPARLIVAHEDVADPSNPHVRSSQDTLRSRQILLVPLAWFDDIARWVQGELPK